MDWIKLAEDIGFEGVCSLNMESLRVLPEVREMCAADRCKAYGTRWTCPPGCGTPEQCQVRMERYGSGILVQTVRTLEDDFDIEGMGEAQKLHGERFARLARQVRALSPDCLPLGAGTCTRCASCTYPDLPCRFPAEQLSSMEAYGLLVSDVCKKSGLPYYHGPGTVTFTACILLT